MEVSSIPGGGAKIPHALQLNIHTHTHTKQKQYCNKSILLKVGSHKKKKSLKKIQTSFKMHS